MAKATAESNSIAVVSTGDGNVNVSLAPHLASLPSTLTPLLMHLVEQYRPQYDSSPILEKSPKIEEKISFNNLRYYANDIRVNSDFMSIIEDILSSIDDADPGSKTTILWTISRSYKNIKRNILMANDVEPFDSVSVQNTINSNSDKIFNLVLEDIFSIPIDNITCERELLLAAKELLVCYGFIGCMILEEPR